MTSVLVVDDDAPLGRALARELRANGYDSMPVSGYDEAMARLSEQSFDVLLTDLRMGDKDGLDLILAITESFPGTRPILMSAYATARDSERAKELGAVRVLCKPFDTSEMLQAVERAVESAEGFLGSLHGLSLMDMLQMFHYAQRSVSVQVQGGVPAAIHLRNGQVVHASYGSVQGEAALSHILTLPAGTLSTGPLESVEQTLSREFQPLMLDLLRQLDEQKRGPLPAGARVQGLAPPAVEPGLGRESALESAALESSPFGSSATPIELGLATSTPPEHVGGSNDADRFAPDVARRPEPGLLSDACRRTAGELRGDVVCAVVDLDHGRLLGCYAARGDAWRRSEALARATLDLFRDAPVQGLGHLLGDGGGHGSGSGSGNRSSNGSGGGGANGAAPGLRRIELTLESGQFLARATRQGRRVMALLLGRDTDARAARTQLDAVFPLVEALAP